MTGKLVIQKINRNIGEPISNRRGKALVSDAAATIAKGIDFGSELDTHEIHINAWNDNFVLFLNKSDFNEQGKGRVMVRKT